MDVLGIILAGGKGERLHPLTGDEAKPAVPIGGKYRLIDFVLSNFINSAISSIIRDRLLAKTSESIAIATLKTRSFWTGQK
jgi:ADP-glucose pyrophosphorylase